MVEPAPLLGPLAPDSKTNADKGLFFVSNIECGGRTKCNRMSVVKQAASQVFTDARRFAKFASLDAANTDTAPREPLHEWY
jgi:hypothetical protein